MEQDGGDGARVLGIGVGLFLLILIWSCTVAGLVLVSRSGSALSTVLIVLASILTIVLLAVPREEISTGKGKFSEFLPLHVEVKHFISNIYAVLICSITNNPFFNQIQID